MRECSIIIPTLNEGDNISPLLERIEAVVTSNDLTAEIIFVDDGSTDSTLEEIEACRAHVPLRVISRSTRPSLSGAVVAGARIAAYPHVVVMDADLSHPPESIPSLLAPLEQGVSDMVIGSRYIEGGSLAGWPLSRKVASELAAIPSRLLTGVRDPLAGFFSVKRNWFDPLDEKIEGFKIGLELIMKNDSPSRVQEIPITFNDRMHGSSKMKSDVIIAYFSQLARLCGLIPPRHGRKLSYALGAVAVCLDLYLLQVLSRAGFTPDSAQIISFLFVLHGAYLFRPQSENSFPPDRKKPFERIKSYLNVLLLMLSVLFIRGAFLALILSKFPITSPLIFLVQVLSVLASWYLILAASSTNSALRFSLRNWRFILIITICYTILLRIAYLGAAELLQEEAYYWNYAQHLAYGYLDHPPVVALLIRTGTMIFGQNEFGVRIGAFACWFATALFVWKYSRIQFDRTIAFGSVFLVSVLPIFFIAGLIITPDTPLITCWAGALYFLYKALVRGQRSSWIGAGIMVGIGLASKYTIALLGPAALLYMIIEPRARKWFFSPFPYAALMIALLIFSPVIFWNYEHNWASFLFQSQHRLVSTTEFSFHVLIGNILLLITPVGFWAAVLSFTPRTIRKLGKWWDEDESAANIRFIAAMTMVPLSVFVLFSLFKEVKLSWTGPLWLAVLPIISTMLVHSGIPDGKSKTLRKSWAAMITLLCIFYGGYLHYFALGLPGIPFPDSTFLVGWKNLALHVEEKVKELEEETGSRPIIVGMDKYRIASGLGFYRSQLSGTADGLTKDQILDETTGRHVFGENSLQYRYWHNPEEYIHRDILAISSSSAQLDKHFFSPYVSNIGVLQQMHFEKSKKTIGPIYYRLLTGYVPVKPNVAQK